MYGIGVLISALRTFARYKAVGFQGFQADEYLVWAAVLFFTAQSVLAYEIGNSAHGLANNSISNGQRMAIIQGSAEWDARVFGSKIQVAGIFIYTALLLLLKLAMLVFYVRLTSGLGSRYRRGIWIGFTLVIATFLFFLGALFIGCRPFERYWQIYPNPGRNCQPAISKPIIWTSYAGNIVTDIYLILIPMPLLWESTLKLSKKLAATFILGAGLFVLVCSTIKSIILLLEPDNGPESAGRWGARESFVALVTTNLPVIFPLFKTMLKPWKQSERRTSAEAKLKPRSGSVRTIGGSGGASYSRSCRKTHGSYPFSETTLMNSEEDITYPQAIKVYLGTPNMEHSGGIIVSNEFHITTENRSSMMEHRLNHGFPDTW